MFLNIVIVPFLTQEQNVYGEYIQIFNINEERITFIVTLSLPLIKTILFRDTHELFPRIVYSLILSKV